MFKVRKKLEKLQKPGHGRNPACEVMRRNAKKVPPFLALSSHHDQAFLALSSQAKWVMTCGDGLFSLSSSLLGDRDVQCRL